MRLPPRAEYAACVIASAFALAIKHIIIVLQENRTFDNLFHGYPGADYAKVGYNHKGKAVQLFELPLMTPWDPSHELRIGSSNITAAK